MSSFKHKFCLKDVKFQNHFILLRIAFVLCLKAIQLRSNKLVPSEAVQNYLKERD